MVWNSIKKLFDSGSPPAAGAGEVEFSRDLLVALAPAGNIALSPASVRFALSMLLVGARGQTASDLEAGLRLGGTSPAQLLSQQAARIALWGDASRPYALAVANALFVAAGLSPKPPAEQSLREAYRASIRALDFRGDPGAAIDAVNAWVNEATRGLIPQIASPGSVGPGTRLVVANALYFKAEWRTRFSRDVTRPAPFEVAPGEQAMVPTMQQTAQHRMWAGAEAEVLEMVYKGDDMAMTFVLPPKGTALSDFESRLRADALHTWLSRLTDERVRVSLPRFVLDSGARSLRGALEALGIRAPFEPGSADFQGFFEEPLVVDDVLHRARVDVNEEGTEAAAATAVFALQSANRRPPKDFTIDRPFLFFLRDVRDGTILFLGRVVDPR